MSTENVALAAAYDAAHEYAEANNLDIRCPIEPIIDVAIDAWAIAKHQANELPIPRLPNCGSYLAKDNTGQWHYLNHAGTWQTCPAPFREDEG